MHIPVLKKEIIDLLQVKKDGKYIDATLGLGGHTIEIAKRGGRVLGIEVDEESLEEAKKRIAASINNRQLQPLKAVNAEYAFSNIRSTHGNFKDIKKIARENGFVPVDGVLFDLGMSSWQLEKSGRGFTFQEDEPLDMRMDKSLAVTAADLLNGLRRDELSKLFKKYGEEQSAHRVAGAIVSARALKPFETTGDLVKVIGESRGRIHPATKIFQALRIAVNDEIGNLRSALPQAFEILGVGGRVVAVSFHSLEDREVKRFIKRVEGEGRGRALTEKPMTPSAAEIKRNPRSRSAKLRGIEKRK